MMFHTIAFVLGFLPVCLAGFFALGRWQGDRSALGWLVASSLFFYAWWAPEHLSLLVASVLANYAIAWKLGRTGSPRGWLAAGIALNLGVLGWFKYADFLLHAVAPSAPALHVALPLAISFFTFQQVMFLVDAAPPRGSHAVGAAIDGLRDIGAGTGRMSPAIANALWPGDRSREGGLARPSTTLLGFPPQVVDGRAKAGHDTSPGSEASPARPAPMVASLAPPPRLGASTDKRWPSLAALLPYAAFVAFFPHLIAGPIVRPSEIIPQLTARGFARPNVENLADGLLVFLLGLGKKLVLADMFGGFADTGFDAAAQGTSLTFFEAWYATLSYALQIYFDFSGYSDMAIGLARMFNVRFPMNFDSPYQATDIAAFWRRWHITLGGFLRDYLYIPLGGNRAGALRQAGNLMATMLLAGLWHGAAWNFVLWGGLHGVFLVAHAQCRRWFPPMPDRIAHAITLFAVTLAWVPFRAATVSGTLGMLGGMAGLNGIALPRMIVSSIPLLAAIADPVSVMPSLGDARTLSFPEVSACLLLGWLIVLTLPNVHRMTERARHWTLTGSFALSVQALFFAPHVAPFLYFQF